jgi:hypothetical protein
VTDHEFYYDVGTFAFNFMVLISIWLRYTIVAGLFLISAIPVFGGINVGGVVFSGLSLRVLTVDPCPCLLLAQERHQGISWPLPGTKLSEHH